VNPARLPAGRCLTDVWGALPRQQRDRWLRVVAREARAAALEAATARAAQRAAGLDLAAVTATVDQARREAVQHAADLLSALDSPRTARGERGRWTS
jgi:hypothetical protein